ncbi:hypothetical protein GIB67_002193 [Kingdonia uniflora]|uniref:Mandelate racemase/muconate lactonizing enzyme C-terminal domain-containing protein n=1 Tax=Kingdonia uniflora TaxID=39325 RepID=A0A7J7KWV3_9MAGN|nr:hypothetical protein GIB67_002193 [Kingdonia uniflora]
MQRVGLAFVTEEPLYSRGYGGYIVVLGDPSLKGRLSFVTEEPLYSRGYGGYIVVFGDPSQKRRLSFVTRPSDLLFRYQASGLEMAVIDAIAKSIGVPLWRLFGGVSNTITTDITIPIVSPAEAANLALKYYKEGFSTSKLKVGKNLDSDIEVLKAIRKAQPDCSFILDANEGYTADEAIEVIEKLHGINLEQKSEMWRLLLVLIFKF